jgi:hypothetical protein
MSPRYQSVYVAVDDRNYACVDLALQAAAGIYDVKTECPAIQAAFKTTCCPRSTRAGINCRICEAPKVLANP